MKKKYICPKLNVIDLASESIIAQSDQMEFTDKVYADPNAAILSNGRRNGIWDSISEDLY